MKKKIAIVVQRYGLDVNGGSELYCRQVAERLNEIYDVTVYTTCALDYVAWKNHYSQGEEQINNVHVKRYLNDREREQKRFDKIHGFVMTHMDNHSDEQEEEWIREQGPYCPQLLEALDRECNQYVAILFMTYLYYLSAVGLRKKYRNTILIPTVHDEPPVYLRVYDKVFAGADGIAWNTEEERAFAHKRFPFTVEKPEVMTGIGIDGPQNELPELPQEIQGSRYITYAGRIDENKGCVEMFDFFRQYKKTHTGSSLKLVVMGKPVIPIPDDPDVISLGFVTEEMKFAVMKNAVALILHSRFESLSMVVLESMFMGRPVLVTGLCEVLKGHCLRSNAGLFFDNYREYEATLDYLLTHPLEYRKMRENGLNYVNENYRWEIIVQKYHTLIETVSRG